MWTVVIVDSGEYDVTLYQVGSEEEAIRTAKELNQAFSSMGADEMEAVPKESHYIMRYDMPRASATLIRETEKRLGRSLKNSEAAIDVTKLAELLQRGTPPALLPEEPKVTDEDVQKAIASITGSV